MEYADIFATRGSDYDRAMRAYPSARDAEFQQLVSRGRPVAGETVADVPAGGSYLAHYLPSNCRYHPHEPCDTFLHGGVQLSELQPGRDLLPLPWESASIDLAVSLAGVHHLEDKSPLFAELWRTVRPGGRLVLSDVAEGSYQAMFLDRAVGAYNATGHSGCYLTSATAVELEAQGWRVVSDERVTCDWQFENIQELGNFCHLLFGMRKTTPKVVQREVARHLGVIRLAGGGMSMPWALQTLVAYKSDT